MRLQFAPEGVERILLDVRQNQILLVADTQFTETVALGQIGYEIHLCARQITRRDAGFLEANSDYSIAGLLVDTDVLLVPVGEQHIGIQCFFQRGALGPEVFVCWIVEKAFAALKFRVRQCQWTVFELAPFLFHFLTEVVDACLFNENLDACLVLVVASSLPVVHAQDGVEVTQQVLLWQKRTNFLANHWGPSKSTTRQYSESCFTFIVANDEQADVVHLRCSLIVLGATHCNLELAR